MLLTICSLLGSAVALLALQLYSDAYGICTFDRIFLISILTFCFVL